MKTRRNKKEKIGKKINKETTPIISGNTKKEKEISLSIRS